MKRATNYLKMRVPGALEYAVAESNLARYRAVSQMAFTLIDCLQTALYKRGVPKAM